jgi:small subunit ribosomal protein S20
MEELQMANHKSAEIKSRRDEKRRVYNKRNRSLMRNKIKSIRKLVNAGKIEDANKALPEVLQVIDQSISKGIIHINTGARYKSRIHKLVKNAGGGHVDSVSEAN